MIDIISIIDDDNIVVLDNIFEWVNALQAMSKGASSETCSIVRLVTTAVSSRNNLFPRWMQPSGIIN